MVEKTPPNQIKQIWKILKIYAKSFPVDIDVFYPNEDMTCINISEYVFPKISMRTDYPKKHFYSLEPLSRLSITQGISISIFWNTRFLTQSNHYLVQFTFYNTNLPNETHYVKLFPATTEPERIASFCFRLIKCMK